MTNMTALITGASSGIGAVYAERLARRGYDLVVVARDLERLDKLAGRLAKDYAVTVTPLAADLSQAAGLQRVLDRIAGDPSLSMVVNSAGLAPKGPILEASDESLGKMVYLNVDVLHALTISASRTFVERKRGAIINIASVVAFMPESFNGSYVATKAFVLGLTQALETELTPHGVRIQAVLPGFTRTEIFERAGGDIAVIPPEMLMEADEMVDAALAGFDAGEIITIPSLGDLGLWEDFERARKGLGPQLSLKHAAARFKNKSTA